MQYLYFAIFYTVARNVVYQKLQSSITTAAEQTTSYWQVVKCQWCIYTVKKIMLVVTFLLKFVCAKFPPKLFAWSEMPPVGLNIGSCWRLQKIFAFY